MDGRGRSSPAGPQLWLRADASRLWSSNIHSGSLRLSNFVRVLYRGPHMSVSWGDGQARSRSRVACEYGDDRPFRVTPRLRSHVSKSRFRSSTPSLTTSPSSTSVSEILLFVSAITCARIPSIQDPEGCNLHQALDLPDYRDCRFPQTNKHNFGTCNDTIPAPLRSGTTTMPTYLLYACETDAKGMQPTVLGILIFFI